MILRLLSETVVTRAAPVRTAGVPLRWATGIFVASTCLAIDGVAAELRVGAEEGSDGAGWRGVGPAELITQDAAGSAAATLGIADPLAPIEGANVLVSGPEVRLLLTLREEGWTGSARATVDVVTKALPDSRAARIPRTAFTDPSPVAGCVESVLLVTAKKGSPELTASSASVRLGDASVLSLVLAPVGIPEDASFQIHVQPRQSVDGVIWFDHGDVIRIEDASAVALELAGLAGAWFRLDASLTTDAVDAASASVRAGIQTLGPPGEGFPNIVTKVLSTPARCAPGTGGWLPARRP